MSGLADWFEKYAASDEAQNKIKERKERAQSINETLMKKKNGLKNGDVTATTEKVPMNGNNTKEMNGGKAAKKNE